MFSQLEAIILLVSNYNVLLAQVSSILSGLMPAKGKIRVKDLNLILKQKLLHNMGLQYILKSHRLRQLFLISLCIIYVDLLLVVNGSEVFLISPYLYHLN
jgi:hypothetical protein